MSAELVAAVPGRALAVFAHPDDSDVSCGGTLARWVDGSCEVHVVICALGDKGTRDALVDPARLVSRRDAEIEAAQRVLGVAGVHRLGRPDGQFENDLELRSELVTLIRTLRPEALICPDPTAVFFGEHYYNHRDHRVVGYAALDAAAPAAALPLYFPESGAPWSIETAYLSGSLEPNVLVDVSATITRKTEAVLCHQSQLGEAGEGFAEALRERSEEIGRPLGIAHGEAFRRISLLP